MEREAVSGFDFPGLSTAVGLSPISVLIGCIDYRKFGFPSWKTLILESNKHAGRTNWVLPKTSVYNVVLDYFKCQVLSVNKRTHLLFFL